MRLFSPQDNISESMHVTPPLRRELSVTEEVRIERGDNDDDKQIKLNVAYIGEINNNQ